MLILKDLLDQYQQLSIEQLKDAVERYYLYDEQAYVEDLKEIGHLGPICEQSIEQLTNSMISVATENRTQPLINQVLSEYQLNKKEGIQLLALAEGLLRIKSADTAKRFIQDKILDTDWETHQQQSPHPAVNMATEGLVLLKQWLHSETHTTAFQEWLHTGKNKLAQEALKLLINKLASIFIKGETISSGLTKPKGHTNHCSSFDMLGESALKEHDADEYLENYLTAIKAIASQNGSRPKTIIHPDTISVKLSALTSKFRLRSQRPLDKAFMNRVETVIRCAHQHQVAITLDAEEADQLDLTLEVFKQQFFQPGLKGWGGLGLAVQAYNFRAIPTLLYLAALSKEHQTPIPVRLVKGAYWDTEINRAQELGLASYPVFTEKLATDLNYQVCAKLLFQLQLSGTLIPQFATHNALTIATVFQLAQELDPNHEALFPLEFQRLHGMGEQIYSALSGYQHQNKDYYCRTYCPIGPYQELLPYLIRRILENGSSQSFLQSINNQTNEEDNNAVHTKLPIHHLLPYERYREKFPLPKDIYRPWMEGSLGLNPNQQHHWNLLFGKCSKLFDKTYQVHSAIPEQIKSKESLMTIKSPANNNQTISINHQLTEIDSASLTYHLNKSYQWKTIATEQRLRVIHRFADLLEEHKYELISLCIKEAGKSWADAIAEIREAIDFCHYYSHQAEIMARPISLPHTSNETNELKYHPKGTFLCISPWNFPIAILIGQAIAALVTGNRVLIKPAPQTPASGRKVYDLLINAGVPTDSLYFVNASNALTQQLLASPGIDGVAFTGSLNTARIIQSELFQHHLYPIPLIAETSGLNCMITDDSVLTEQMVRDVITSAFGSAGQRCSALRVLFVHEAIYHETIKEITGVMSNLTLADPVDCRSDLGPLIDQAALTKLTEYLQLKQQNSTLLYQPELQQLIPKPGDTSTHSAPKLQGYYMAPALVKLNNLSELEGEHFGPILHIISYKPDELGQLIQDIENSQYALTLGIHSRDRCWVEHLCSKLSMGNIYINRHITGAQVGAQPFGGHKRSGNGFKAGGPNYLLQFVNEQCVSENIAAIGGNTHLISQ
jgi:RHH-type proline utilization regulon transcriptional repressor/proline dehydrogenase/delta 1-pyrroline-5-carboxylate dehydrogenase